MARPSESLAIEARELVKTYPGGRGKPRIRALDGVSFGVETGTIFGLLGPNGAGKSTSVRILSTLSRPDSGGASIAGVDLLTHPDRVRKTIGFVAQKAVTDPMDTGRENLILAGQLQGMPRRSARARAAELLDRFSLTDSGDRLVKAYSGGMARKLDVAIGLMHRPQVLFLDEPTTGLDPEARAEMWAELESMATAEQMTVLLTTHYLDEADRLASQLAIVDHGRVVVTGSPDELKNGLRGDAVFVELAPETDLDSALRAISRVRALGDVIVDGRVLRGRAAVGATALPQVLGALDDDRLLVASATVARPSLDDVYLKYTGHTFVSSTSAATKENAA
ncbi:MAG: type transport system ATP-binding protein [Actinomycetota bacterium]|jgi:ABC-2 type transport system ATP-binding protein|nr:type transport system ATP-binding protein [Actinomycetota bacterium]